MSLLDQCQHLDAFCSSVALGLNLSVVRPQLECFVEGGNSSGEVLGVALVLSLKLQLERLRLAVCSSLKRRELAIGRIKTLRHTVRASSLGVVANSHHGKRSLVQFGGLGLLLGFSLLSGNLNVVRVLA